MWLSLLWVMVLVVVGAQTCVTAPAGLVSCWPADFNAKDIVGDNDGTLEGGATVATGLAGQAFSFDGVDGFVNVPDSTSLDAITTGITVDAWINPQDGVLDQIIFGRRDPCVSEGFTIAIGGAGGDAVFIVSVRTTDGTSAFESESRVIQLDQWQHIAATADIDTGQVRAYVNGDPVSLMNIAGPDIISGPLFNVNNLFIGRRQRIVESCEADEASAGHYAGLIDEVKLFSRALDATEIKTLFRSYLSQAIQNLIQDVIALDLVPGFHNNRAGTSCTWPASAC